MPTCRTATLTVLAAWVFAAASGGLAPASAESRSEDYIACELRAEGSVYKGSCQVTCSVDALAINFDGAEPSRVCNGPVRTVDADLAKTQAAGRWLGNMQGVKPEDPKRFEVVANDTDGGRVGRTPFGWFAVTEMKEADGKLTLRMDADRQARPTAKDLAILARAIELLSNESVWNKSDDRECPKGQVKLSLFCALIKATNEISGGIHYRQPAMQAVREEAESLLAIE